MDNKEKKIQDILNKYDFKGDLLSYLRSFSNNIDFERKKLFSQKELSINKEISKILYGEIYIKSLPEEMLIKKEEEFFFKSGDPELNIILEGGFHKGKLYEIIGPSLSGKTTLVKSIINENINSKNTKILLFSFINENYENDYSNYKNIKFINECLSINDIILYLTTPENKIEEYNLIIFDPLTVVLSKDIKEDLMYVEDFNKILNILIYKFKCCVILIGMAKALKVIQLEDMKNNKIYEVREYDSFLPNNLPLKEAVIKLYKISRKNFEIKYYLKVNSPNLYNGNSFFEINYNSDMNNMEIDNYN